jgi:5-methylcytosine-specific restriction endonuclease McrA
MSLTEDIKSYQKNYRETHKDKAQEYRKNYYQLNKIKMIQDSSKSYRKNKEQTVERRKKYRSLNREKIREWNRKSKLNHYAKVLKAGREYYHAHKEKAHVNYINRYAIKKVEILTKAKEYARANPLILKNAKKKYLKTLKGIMANRLYTQKYRLAKLRAGFELTTKQVLEIFERDKDCVYCHSSIELTLDHIIPVIKNGKTCVENIVVACRKCNSSKHNKNVFEWLSLKGYQIPNIILQGFTYGIN